MRDYGMTNSETFTQTPDIFYNIKPTKEIPITLGKGTGELKRGCVLGIKTADGKYYPFKDNATDGTQIIAGVLGETINVAAGDEVSFAYVSGEFIWQNLTAGNNAVIPVGSINNGAMTFKKGVV